MLLTNSPQYSTSVHPVILHHLPGPLTPHLLFLADVCLNVRFLKMWREYYHQLFVLLYTFLAYLFPDKCHSYGPTLLFLATR